MEPTAPHTSSKTCDAASAAASDVTHVRSMQHEIARPRLFLAGILIHFACKDAMYAKGVATRVEKVKAGRVKKANQL